MPETSPGAPLGVFGGTFDPLHYGHLRLAEEAADSLRLGAVRWLPAGQPALRQPPQASAAQRLEMVRLATVGNPRFEVDAAEVLADRISYTVTTLERLRQPEVCGTQRPLVLLLGADAFRGLAEWHRWPDLFALAHIAVAHRPGYALAAEHLPEVLAEHYRRRLCADPAELAAAPAGRIATFAMTPLDISATNIRVMLSNLRSARYLMPDALTAYIKDQRLYSEN